MLTPPNPDASVDSPDRVTPPCPHFGPCGGCQLQDLAYPAQLSRKSAQLRVLLESVDVALPELQLHPSPPLAYRNRIRLTLAQAGGQLRAGYLRNIAAISPTPPTEIVIPTEGEAVVEGHPHFARSAISPSFLPVTHCPIAAPILWRTAEALLALVNNDPTPWLRAADQTPDQLELFTTADESRLNLTLYLRASAKTLPAKLATAFTTLCDKLQTAIPELNGAGIALLPAASTLRSRRTEQPRPGPAWGSPGLSYRIDRTGYWVPRGAFFQINRFLLPELLGLVTSGRTGALAWDLYAGVGLFSRALASTFARVTTVEIAEPAPTTLASTGLKNLHAVKATTLDFLRAAILQRDRPDLIVLDPPRTGAGPEVCALLARIATPTLIYVSCSPQTLPADLKTLTASGYALDELHLFDLFPQTNHIETVALLTR